MLKSKKSAPLQFLFSSCSVQKEFVPLPTLKCVNTTYLLFNQKFSQHGKR